MTKRNEYVYIYIYLIVVKTCTINLFVFTEVFTMKSFSVLIIILRYNEACYYCCFYPCCVNVECTVYINQKSKKPKSITTLEKDKIKNKR